MSEEPTVDEAAWKRARRQRLAEIFGDALPEQVRDDVDAARSTPSGDQWLEEQVPPHHG